jgi:hypothetical protein
LVSANIPSVVLIPRASFRALGSRGALKNVCPTFSTPARRILCDRCTDKLQRVGINRDCTMAIVDYGTTTTQKMRLPSISQPTDGDRVATMMLH